MIRKMIWKCQSPRIQQDSASKRSIGLSGTGLRWELIVAAASLSVVLFLEAPLLAQDKSAQKLTEAYKLEREGKYAAAISLIRPLLDSGPLDPSSTGKAWDVLGMALKDQGNFDESRRAFEQSLQSYEASSNVTTDHATALDDFGELYVLTGQLPLAERMMERALHLYESAQDHAGVTRGSNYLAGVLLSQNKVREGRKILDHAVKESRRADELGDDDLATLASLQGWLAKLDGDLPTSILKYQRSLELLRRYYGEEHASTGWAYVLLGKARAESGDLSKSLAEMNAGLAILGHTLNHRDPRFLTAEIAYSRVLESAGKSSEARSLRSEAEGEMKTFDRDQCVDCTVSAKAFR